MRNQPDSRRKKKPMRARRTQKVTRKDSPTASKARKSRGPTSSFDEMQSDIAALRKALITALAWIAQSANSPLRVDEASRLIKIAEKTSHDDTVS